MFSRLISRHALVGAAVLNGNDGIDQGILPGVHRDYSARMITPFAKIGERVFIHI